MLTKLKKLKISIFYEICSGKLFKYIYVLRGVFGGRGGCEFQCRRYDNSIELSLGWRLPHVSHIDANTIKLVKISRDLREGNKRIMLSPRKDSQGVKRSRRTIPRRN